MADHADTQGQQRPPQPDPALRALDQFVGAWRFRGHILGSDEDDIVGHASYRWLDGGFFLVQDVEIDFAGMFHVKSHELIGHDTQTGPSARSSSRTCPRRRCRTAGTSRAAT